MGCGSFLQWLLFCPFYGDGDELRQQRDQPVRAAGDPPNPEYSAPLHRRRESRAARPAHIHSRSFLPKKTSTLFLFAEGEKALPKVVKDDEEVHGLKYRMAVVPETLNCEPIFAADTISRNALIILTIRRLVER